MYLELTVQSEKMSLALVLTCYVILGKLLELGKLFKPLDLSVLICIAEIVISLMQSCKNDNMCTYI